MRLKKYLILIILSLATTIFGRSSHDFTQFRYDKHHSGVSQSPGPMRRPKLLWSFYLKATVTGAPIFKNGILYFGDLDNHFYALDGYSGKVLWSKTLKSRGDEPVGIHNSPAIYRKLVIVASGDGYLYAFNRKTGQIKWGPKDLKEPIYSSPIVRKKNLLITTAGEGTLWILKLSRGGTILKTSIGTPVYSTLVINEKPSTLTLGDNPTSSTPNPTIQPKIDYELYITVPSKVITYQIELKSRKAIPLKEIPIDGSITSSPVFYKEKLYFSTRRFLYCISRNTVKWVKRVKPIAVHDNRKTYPSPVVIGNLVIHGSKGYNAEDGTAAWHFWSYGRATSDAIASPKILYMVGKYTLYDRTLGFIAGIRVKTEGLVFWSNLPSPPIAPPIIAGNIIYLATEKQWLYALR